MNRRDIPLSWRTHGLQVESLARHLQASPGSCVNTAHFHFLYSPRFVLILENTILPAFPPFFFLPFPPVRIYSSSRLSGLLSCPQPLSGPVLPIDTIVIFITSCACNYDVLNSLRPYLIFSLQKTVALPVTHLK